MAKYEYETSPRKVEPEYKRKKQNKNKKIKKVQRAKREKKKQVKENKTEIKKSFKFKSVMCLIVGFAVLFVISYRNSIINEEFAEVKSMQKELAQLEKENEQLNINIQNDLNLSQIEKSAKELLGMQKLTSAQTVNVNLSKKDYVEPSSEEVVIEEKDDFLTSIINFIKNIF